MTAFYQERRDRFVKLIAASRFRPLACRGTYFQLLDYSAITDEDDMDFALRLIREHGVAAIPDHALSSRRRSAPDACCASVSQNATIRWQRAAERLRRGLAMTRLLRCGRGTGCGR